MPFTAACNGACTIQCDDVEQAEEVDRVIEDHVRKRHQQRNEKVVAGVMGSSGWDRAINFVADATNSRRRRRWRATRPAADIK